MASVSRVVLLDSALTATRTGDPVSLELYSYAFKGYIAATAVNGATTINAKIQHSADKLNWFDLITFAAIAGVASAEAKDPTVNVLPYVRAVATLTGGVQAATVTVALYFDKVK